MPRSRKIVSWSGLLLVAISTGGCDDLPTGDLPTGDPVTVEDSGCNPTLLNALGSKLTEWFGDGSGFSLTQSCGTYAREITTGVTLGPSADGTEVWNDLGGRGEVMADAGLCLLADLEHFGSEGHVVSEAELGPFSTRQRLGQTEFDPVARRWVGYQIVDVCGPMIDCFEVQRRVITADVVSSPSFGNAGVYPVEDAYALQIHTERPSLVLGVDLPTLTFVTPIGPVDVTPHFGLNSELDVIGVPFPHVDDTLHYMRTEPMSMQDTNGRAGIGLIVQTHPLGTLEHGGWVSQLGFGQRDSTTSLWDPTGGTPAERVRPDLDMPLYAATLAPTGLYDLSDATMDVPRTTDEAMPVTHVHLDGEAVYDLTAYLPFDLVWPLNVDEADVVVAVNANADFGAQTQLVSREGDPRSGEFDELPSAQVMLQSASSAAATTDITITVDLELSLGGFFPVQIHRSIVVPLPFGDHDYSVGDFAYATSRSDPEHEPDLFSVHTWSGNEDAPDMILECLDHTPMDIPLPDPQRSEQGIALFDLLPCNLCAWRAGFEADGVNYPPMGEFVAPFGEPGWTCNPQHDGCMDLCRFDTETGEFTMIALSANDEPNLCTPGPS
jgi:hypothetical protein